MKIVSRLFDIQKNNQIKNHFTGVPDTDIRACFNQSTWIPAINLLQFLQKLKTSWITTVMAFGGATVAQLYRIVELMNPGRIVAVMILIDTNNVTRSSDLEDTQWEAMLVCLFSAVWQKFQRAALTVCTIPLSD